MTFSLLLSTNLFSINNTFPLHLLKKSIRPFRIKHLITSHHRYEIFCLRQIDNIMCPSRNHIYTLYLLSADFKLHDFSRVDVAFLDQSVSMDYDKLFPLTVVPVLSLCYPRFADINRYLSTIRRVHKLCKTSSVITIHLHGIFKLFCWKVC